jgi:AraC-like DNA-binding protein
MSAQEDESLQRVGFLVVVPDLLRGFGVDPAKVLAAAGLDESALSNPEGVIPYAAMGRLVQIAVEETKTPHFGLLIGQRIGTVSLGLIGELMHNAPTMGVALGDLAAHQHRHARGAVIYVLAQQTYAIFGYAVYHPSMEGNAHIFDGAAAAAFNIVRSMVRADEVDRLEVLLSRRRPEDVAPYAQFFGAIPSFDADQTGVVFPVEWLHRPLTGANAERRKVLEMRVQAYAPAGVYDVVPQLRRALRVGLLTGEISGKELAAQLHMTRRTLHRRLNAQGVNFQQILDETRFEFSQQLLTNTRLSISDIGLILRYADPAAFTRAFFRWANITPTEWRSTHKVVDASPRESRGHPMYGEPLADEVSGSRLGRDDLRF